MGKSDSKKRQREGEAEDLSAAEKTDQQPESNPPAAKKARTEANRSLFVRSLPPSATDKTLTDFFSEHYPVKHAVVIVDPKTRQSRGYGFVTFTDEDDTLEAKEKLNNHLLDGRRLRLEIAEARHRDAAKAGNTAVHSKVAEEKRRREEALAEARKPAKLIIRNLPWSIKKEEQLAALFRSYGKVRFADLPQEKGKLKGFGFVTLRGRKNAEKALEALNGKVVDGRTIAVDWAVDKQTWEQQKDADQGNGSVEKDRSTKDKKDKAGKKGVEDEEEEEEEGEEEGDDENDARPMTQEEADLANFMKNHMENLEDEDENNSGEEGGSDQDDDDEEEEGEDGEDGERGEEDDEDDEDSNEDGGAEVDEKPKRVTDNSTTIFIRNLPFTTTDEQLKAHFSKFGAVRYARVVVDRATDRPAGTGFVCFFNMDDFKGCLKGAPRHRPAVTTAKHSVLQDETVDADGRYTLEGRVLRVTQAVNKDEAARLTSAGLEGRDRDKRRLYLLSEGAISSNSPLFSLLPAAEVKMREDSAKQRKKLIQGNPALHLSLTRLAIRNLPRNVGSKELKALAREAVVGFAKDVKEGRRQPLSKEELARGGPEEKEAERIRREKKKGIVRQAKIVFETKEGTKVDEKAGASKSRGYGFIEYSSHRWALMGLRWLNGHAVKDEAGKTRRLIVEFAIENANVVQRRKQMEERSRQRAAAPGGKESNKADEAKKQERASGKGKSSGKHENTKDDSAGVGRKGKETDSKLAMRTKIIARKRQMRKKKATMRKGK